MDTPNMGPDYVNVPLAAELEADLGLPAFLDRDTNVAALGEMSFGAARGCRDFLYLTVSTGVGGAIVSGGQLFHGPDGTAGELGHLPVAMEGICTCGGIGHLEGYASGAALARMAREIVASGTSPYLAAVAARKGADALDAGDVAAGEVGLRRSLRRIRRRAQSQPHRRGRRNSGLAGRTTAGACPRGSRGPRLSNAQQPRQDPSCRAGRRCRPGWRPPTSDRASRRPGLAQRSVNPQFRADRMTPRAPAPGG